MAAVLLPLLAAQVATTPAPAPAQKKRRKMKPYSALTSHNSRLKRVRAVSADVRNAFMISCERNGVDQARFGGFFGTLGGERLQIKFEEDGCTLSVSDMTVRSACARCPIG